VNIQGAFREHSVNIQGTLRGTLSESSGNIQGTIRAHSGNTERKGDVWVVQLLRIQQDGAYVRLVVDFASEKLSSRDARLVKALVGSYMPRSLLLLNTFVLMMMISSFGQLGLWAPSSGARDVFTSTAYVFT
jgi:hypothetical protein